MHVLDAKNPRVELEARNTEIVWDGELVKASPKTRHGLQWQCGHDLYLPRENVLAYEE